MGNKASSMLQDEEIKLISEETGFSPAQVERLYSRFTSLDKSGICGSLSREDFLRVPELQINPLCERIVHMFFVDCDDDHDRINFRQFMKVLATFRSSIKPTRSRQASRQESIQNILTSLSQNKYRHSRHSSCDGFFNYYPVQHHTTNQHSIHYVASTTHLAQYPFSAFGNNNANNLLGSNHGHNNNGNTALVGGGGPFGIIGPFKKPHSVNKIALIDPDEPPNSRKQKLHFMFKIYDVDNDDRISLDDLKKILNLMVGSYISETKLLDLAVRTMSQADKNNDGYIDFDEFCTAFLHRDIDDLLKVKFSTQQNSGTNNSNNNTTTTNNNNKSNDNSNNTKNTTNNVNNPTIIKNKSGGLIRNTQQLVKAPCENILNKLKLK